MNVLQIILWVTLSFATFLYSGTFFALIVLWALFPVLVLVKAAKATHNVSRWMLLALVSIIVFAIMPALLAGFAELIAGLGGCPVVTFDPQFHCVIVGADWGNVLSHMMILIWAAIATLRLSVIGLFAWVGIALYRYLSRRKFQLKRGT